MTIDEAIKTLSEMRETNLNYYSPNRRKALSLGIEALKHIRTRRVVHPIYEVDKLPGETKS
jgi:hypothetical protein